MKKITSVLLSFVLFAGFAVSPTYAKKADVRVTEFKEPDIKNAFCGVHINFQFCKCAFHGDYCNNIGMDKGGANSHVYAEFNHWVGVMRDEFGAGCGLGGGKAMKGGNECHYCDAPNEWVGNSCEKPEFRPDGPFDKDCNLNPAFDGDWGKYSDIDVAIPFADKNHIAQQLDEASDQLGEKILEAWAIEEQMEIDRLARLELREIKKAVVFSSKANLLRAFWRLSYVTYMTIGSGVGAGKSYSKLLDGTTTGIAAVGDGLKLIQANIPKSDKNANIDTNTDLGKIKSMTLNAQFEALASAGNPVAVATKVVEDIGKLPQPSMDISDDEIQILADHYQRNKDLDIALQESYKANALRRRDLMALEREMEQLKVDIVRLREEEKDRVALDLTESCKEQKKEYESQ